MDKDKLKFFYNPNRKIKPGLTANKSLCYLVESFPEEMQKFAMSFLLNEFANEEESAAPDLTPRCKNCNQPISTHLKKTTGMCRKCSPTICSNLFSKLPPPKGVLKEAARTMLIKDIAEHYNVSSTVIIKWLKNYGIKERKFSHENRKRVPSKEVLVKDLEVLTIKEISEKYNVSKAIIYIWRKRYGLSKRKPLKEEFEINYKKMTKETLAVKYNVCPETISNWAKKYKL